MSLFWELWSRIAATLAGWLHEDEYFSLKISFLRRRQQQIIFLPNDWHFNGSWEFPFLRRRIFPVLSFIANVPVKAFLVVLCVLGQIYFWQGFNFPNLMPGCSGSSSAFLPGPVSLLPPSGSCLCVFSLPRSSLFTLGGLFSPDFLFVGMHCSRAWSLLTQSEKLHTRIERTESVFLQWQYMEFI